MKRFLIKIILFILFFISIQILIFIFISKNHMFLPSMEYYCSEFNKVYKKNKDFDVVVIGNSRVLASIDKKILEKNLNLKVVLLGYLTSDISTTRLILESYLNRCKKKPEIVILEVSWFTFNRKRTTFHTIVGDLVLEDPNLFKYIFRYDPFFINNYITATKHSLKSILFGKSRNVDYGENFKKSEPYRKSYKFDIKNFEKIFPNHVAGIHKLLLEDFYKIVSICLNNQIKLILYTAPEDKEYSLNQKDRNKILNIFHNVDKKNKNVIYLNYSLGGKYYDKKYELWLKDSDHLRENKLFTTLFVKDIKSLTKNLKML